MTTTMMPKQALIIAQTNKIKILLVVCCFCGQLMILIIGPQRYLSEIIMTQCNRILRLHALRHLDGRGTVSNKTKIK